MQRYHYIAAALAYRKQNNIHSPGTNQFGQSGFPMCEIQHVPAVIPGMAAAQFDDSTIGIDVIPGGAIRIIEVC